MTDQEAEQRSSWLPIILGAIAFLLLTSVQGYLHLSGFTSPDEEVNFSAARQFSQAGNFFLGSAVAEDDTGVVKPRNVQVRDDHLVPLSFLGFPLLTGLAARLFGDNAILFVTPVLAALALIAYYRVTAYVWGTRVGIISFWLLVFFPGFIFFTVKSMWHTVAFVAFVIFSAYFFIAHVKQHHRPFVIVSGLMLGIAVSIRTNELVWLAVLALAGFLWLRPRLSIRWVLLFVLAVGIGLLPVLVANTYTFGHPLSFGYTAALERSGELAAGADVTGKIKTLVVPAEQTLSNYITHSSWYGFKLTTVYTLVVLIGLVALVFGFAKPASRRWLIMAAFITAWLVWYYGGTAYYGGQTTATGPIIGSSFVRYFLPLILLYLPVAAAGSQAISRLIDARPWRRVLLASIGVVLAVTSINLVVNDSEGGLGKYFRQDLPQIVDARQTISTSTETDAIIIAGSKDKLFFPERQVMGYNEVGEKHLVILPRLLGRYPIYYNDKGARDADRWDAAGRQHGYGLTKIGAVGQDPLFRFEPLPK